MHGKSNHEAVRQDRHKALELRAAGVSTVEIAERLGRHRVTVSKWLAGVPRPCARCGATFIPVQDGGRYIYCSQTCQVFTAADRRRDGRSVPRVCPWCETAFLSTNGRQRFCTPEHLQLHKALELLREHGVTVPA